MYDENVTIKFDWYMASAYCSVSKTEFFSLSYVFSFPRLLHILVPHSHT